MLTKKLLSHFFYFGRSAGETVTLRYYDSVNGIIYVIPAIVKM